MREFPDILADFRKVAKEAKPKTFEEATFITLLSAELMISKQHDYGHRNITDFESSGY